MINASKLAAPAVIALAIGAAVATAAESENSVRVLLLSGSNNHDWAATTPILSQLFERTPRFALVARIDNPARCDAAMFARCDVVVSNWSAFPAMTGRQWGAVAEKAFVEFVASGKGFVVFHAASATCQDWPEFQQLVGLTWGMDQTGHSSYHTFKVKVEDREHPITRGLRDFWIQDELWHRMAAIAPPAYQVLCTAWSHPDFGGIGKDEPIVLTTRLEAGRGVNIVLGHDGETLTNAAWQVLMLRAAEWAATGETTIPVPEDWPATAAAAMVAGVDVAAALEGVAGYRLGGSRAALGVVERLVMHSCARNDEVGVARRNALAARIGAMLATGVHADVKEFLCAQLGVIGTSAEVPVLASLLADERLGDRACAALEKIPGPAAGAALIDALSVGALERQTALVNALGNRGERAAVVVIAGHLRSPVAGLAEASASALARIGGDAALEALFGAWSTDDQNERRVALILACVKIADGLTAEGRTVEAEKIYARAYETPYRPEVRMPALRGLIARHPEQADRLLLEAIVGEDRPLASMAVGLVRARGARNGQMQDPVVAWLSARLKESTQRAATRALLTQVGRQRTLEAMQLARRFLGDPNVREDACMAVVESAGTLVDTHRSEVKAAMREVVATAKLPETLTHAKFILGRAARTANLARGATASSPDGLDTDGGSGPDAAAIDGNPDTYWDEVDGQKLYRFTLTFPQPTDVSCVVIKGHAYQSFSPRDFEVLCDDTIVAIVKDARYEWQGNEVSVVFPRTRCGTLELRITSAYGGSPGIRELEVYDIDER